ncbi:ThuA domain-containing protein [Armatimonas sp.]|uniref:ThuA domain-containing protein n=1 Tax=Armatimonas sp. TaxID=1872638 RepID=UPI00286B826E|nr:ThuA domain-containing protein [Armatimonas sp.]
MIVTVWGENLHEKQHEAVQKVYPNGMHNAIAEGLRELLGESATVRTATLDQPEHGLTDEILASTDVLTWWGHMGHDKVDDAIVEKVHKRVLEGMGLIVLHSGHFSKIFRKLMGTTCGLIWRDDDFERVWTVRPGHPITEGLPPVFTVPLTEMYGEYFDIPQPDELVFISSYGGGEVFRSGCCWNRGRGKVFYFSPGHETYPIYFQPEIRRVIANACKWAAPTTELGIRVCPHAPQGWFETNPNLGWEKKS